MKHVVEYALAYNHIVRVGIDADTEAEAIAKAKELFDAGDIWNNTPAVPLLMDEFEEQEDNLLDFVVHSVADEYPDPDYSARKVTDERAYKAVAQRFIAAFRDGESNGGSVDWDALGQAFEVATQANLPEVHA